MKDFNLGILVAKNARAALPVAAVLETLVMVALAFGWIDHEQSEALHGAVAATVALVMAFTSHKDLKGVEESERKAA